MNDALSIKTPEALAAIREGGRLLGEVLAQVGAAAVSGATTKQLDEIAERLIRACGGAPAFLGYRVSSKIPAFPATLCVSVNDEVVHGIPGARVLHDGDIVGLDIGMSWAPEGSSRAYVTDTAMTVAVGKISDEDALLMERTRTALFAGIAAAHAGNFVHDISAAIEQSLTPYEYGIVRDLVGHGVGYEVHEPPQVPNYIEPRAPRVQLRSGMVLALEPMVNRGGAAVYTADDGWTIKTRDKSRSAHFEHTIIITDGDAQVVTRRPDEAY